MISNSKDYIFNSDLQYPPISNQGKHTSTSEGTVVLAANVAVGSDYQVFGPVTSGTYGAGMEKKLAWIDNANNLRCNSTVGSVTYWRVYAY